mgnify:CR=1 FL=1
MAVTAAPVVKAALPIPAAAMSPLALTVYVGLLALSATLFALIVGEFMAERRA